MTTLTEISPAVLSSAEARELETRLLGGDEAREWDAMRMAGAAVGREVLCDYQEIGPFSPAAHLLVLVGKGNNGGDALIAAQTILAQHSGARADVHFVFGERSLRPLAARAWRQLVQAAPDRVDRTAADFGGKSEGRVGSGRHYDLCLDGIFGFQFRPPVEPRIADLLARVNALPIRLRAAVDLPSAGLFHADFTYATGSVKQAVFDSNAAGRVRYLDLGFFRSSTAAAPSVDHQHDGILTTAVLDPLRRLRPSEGDKRSYGRVFFVGGSRGFPGAILMSVMGAVRSGAGLTTAFVPESLVAAYAAQLPEAIWVGWPETPAGGLALAGEHLLRERIQRADALVVGPGLGREPETLALVAAMVQASTVPLVIDADALQTEIVMAGAAPRIITPHAGEFKRIAGDTDLRGFAQAPNLTVVLKGPVTRVTDGGPIFLSTFGGPVLARGGSGDVLSGMIGAQLAQNPHDPLVAAARGVVWHGRAAELLARAHGQVAVRTTQLLDYLNSALRA